MSASECTYVLDPDAPETWGGSPSDRCFLDTRILEDTGRWHCSFPAVPESDRCQWHDGTTHPTSLPPPRGGRIVCPGARFGELDVVDTSTAETIICPHATIAGELTLDGAPESYLDFAGTSIKGMVRVAPSKFGGYLAFAGVRIEGDVDFTGIQFGQVVDVSHSTVHGDLSITKSMFAGAAKFGSMTLAGDLDASDTNFEGLTSFSRTTVGGRADFRRATFGDSAKFLSFRVSGDAKFSEASFAESPEFAFSEFGEIDRSGIR